MIVLCGKPSRVALSKLLNRTKNFRRRFSVYCATEWMDTMCHYWIISNTRICHNKWNIGCKYCQSLWNEYHRIDSSKTKRCRKILHVNKSVQILYVSRRWIRLERWNLLFTLERQNKSFVYN